MIKKAIPKMPLEISDVFTTLIVCTCTNLRRDNGIIIGYDDSTTGVIHQKEKFEGNSSFWCGRPEIEKVEFY